MLRRCLSLLLLAVLSLAAACSSASSAPEMPSASPAEAGSISLSGDSFPLTVTDTAKRSVKLEKRPERVVFLSGTPLNIWYDAGGTAVGRPELTGNLRLASEHAEKIMALPSVGLPYATDTEAVAVLNPDLVVGIEGVHDSAAAAYQNLGIATVLLRVRSHRDLQQVYRAFGVLGGNPELAGQRLAAIDARYSEILAKAPKKPLSVAILFVTADTISVKLDNSIAGQMANDLGLTNIASGATPDNPGSETTPLDIEFIVARQPDHVLVTSMVGNNDLARQTLQTQLDQNPAWKAIDAIREGRISYLPQQYFLFNAGPYYDDALAYLAATVHPEVFGAPVEP